MTRTLAVHRDHADAETHRACGYMWGFYSSEAAFEERLLDALLHRMEI